jgi:hypothetical protein
LVPLLILQAGENPLWFELGDEGPRVIKDPDEASLSPFVPWPLARHIRFILPRGEELVMGVNREGFLRFAPWDRAGSPDSGGIALYRHADVPYWGQYTLGALFPFGEGVAALLYRDDFFSETGLPLPGPRVFSLERDSPELRALELPALEEFPAGEGWDVDALRPAPDGYWYYRGIRKNIAQPEIAYRRTRDLGLRGEAVSVSGFQNSALPEPAAAAPALLGSALAACFAPGSGGGFAVAVSPDFPGPRRFAGAGAEAAEGIETGLTGFYREQPEGGPGIALVIGPGGRGIFAREIPGGPAALSPFSLPPLPPGFVYTGAALCGDTLIALWEEQEGWNIGAAGFMAIKVLPR